MKMFKLAQSFSDAYRELTEAVDELRSEILFVLSIDEWRRRSIIEKYIKEARALRGDTREVIAPAMYLCLTELVDSGRVERRQWPENQKLCEYRLKMGGRRNTLGKPSRRISGGLVPQGA